jgi:hypothetical protein
MNSRSWVVSVLTVTLIAACTDGTETTTTPAGDALPTATPDPCFYLTGFVVVEEGQGENAVGVLDDFVGTYAVASPADVLGADSPAIEAIDENLDLISVSEDPLQVAQALIDAEMNASPIHAVGLASHWQFKPGTDPIPTDTPLGDPTVGEGDGFVGVVDSGMVDPETAEGLPAWMSPEFVDFDPVWDLEDIGTQPTQASHGTFVVSLIRQLAPASRVSFARARPVPTTDIVGHGEALPGGMQYVSTELHVAEAVIRLIDRSQNMTALNLSLGTYTCQPGGDPQMIALMVALDLWFASHPDSLVFAAGGNESYEEPFWPAGLSLGAFDASKYQHIDPTAVRGIGAVNETGTQVVWGQAAATAAATLPKQAPNRAWVNNVAPGCDLLGVRGGLDVDGRSVVAWSGSSFATAVSTARYAAAVDSGAAAQPVDHGYEPDLPYESHRSCDIQ